MCYVVELGHVLQGKREMNVLKLIGGVVALMALLALVGCVQVFGPEENGEDNV